MTTLIIEQNCYRIQKYHYYLKKQRIIPNIQPFFSVSAKQTSRRLD